MIFDEQPKTRQEIWDRIRATSKDQYVLEEMVRLGFWGAGLPEDPSGEVERRGKLLVELKELRKRLAVYRDPQKLLKEVHAKRKAEALQRRKETKERRLRERSERAEEWKKKKETEVVYLGAGVSAGLGRKEGDPERLGENDVPALDDAPAIAAAMGIDLGALRFLAFSREVAKVSHYQCFKIKKRTGGERLISAPRPRLKSAQHWILRNVLDKVEMHPAAHGFRKGRSIVSNAQPHVGAAVVVNLDLEDFFPSVIYPRVKGVFRWLGYSEEAAIVFALLTTEFDRDEVELDGTTWHVATSPRHLPQGAPTSPAITNVLCRRLDRRLVKAAGALGFTYTRYADDLTFSAKDRAAPVGKLLRQVHWLIEEDGLRVHPKKTRVLRSSRRQEVTGVVVNERPTIARSTLKRFRATLYQIEKDGPEGKHWGASSNVLESIRGFANFVCMVNPEKGVPLRERVEAIRVRYGRATPAPKPAASTKGADGSLVSQLERLVSLWESGVLTDDEFQQAKRKLLGL